MATIDEIFENMPAEASVNYEELIIDAESREILVPDAEALFGVESDTQSERKYFRCPRYVGDGLDLASCFLRVNFRNANGDVDSYLVTDVSIDGEYITFSWELSRKVTAYKGAVQFNVCAIMGAGLPEWNTTLAEGLVLEGLEPDSSTVENETADVVAQLLATVAAQTAAVEAVGAAQRAEVQRVGENTTEEAKATVEAKGEAVKASIPEDYSTLSATVDKLTRDRAAAIVCEAEGESIQVADSSADPLVGLRIFGKSTQDGTPTPDAPVEIVSAKAPTVGVYGKNLFDASKIPGKTAGGVTLTNHGDGSFTVSGNGTLTEAFSAVYTDRTLPKLLSVGTLTLDAGATTTPAFHLYGMSADGERLFTLYHGWSQEITHEIIDRIASVTFTIYANAGNTIVPGSIKPMLYQKGDGLFEKYKEAQTFTLSTPTALPGIPVTSGGNYTDANGQQWIADEIDLTRGVYVQRCGVIESYAGESIPEQYISTTGQLTTDAKVLYVLATPIETPLSTEEIEVYKALLANKPTTTVLNDAGAWMALEYAADPKTYIDNKIAALLAAKN